MSQSSQDPGYEWQDQQRAKVYDCSICLSTPDNPASIGCPNGHFFCHQCITDVANSAVGPTFPCPHCRAVCSRHNIRPMPEMMQLINNEPISCTARDDNGVCGWSGCYSDFAMHQSQCGFEQVTCTECCGKVSRRSMEAHLAECGHVFIACPKCGDSGIMRKFLDEHFKHHCVEQEELCIHCNHVFVRKNMQDHMLCCPKVPKKCPFHSYGCDAILGHNELKQHIFEESYDHLLKMRTTFEGAFHSLKTENKKLRAIVLNLHGRIENLEHTADLIITVNDRDKHWNKEDPINLIVNDDRKDDDDEDEDDVMT